MNDDKLGRVDTEQLREWGDHFEGLCEGIGDGMVEISPGTALHVASNCRSAADEIDELKERWDASVVGLEAFKVLLDTERSAHAETKRELGALRAGNAELAEQCIRQQRGAVEKEQALQARLDRAESTIRECEEASHRGEPTRAACEYFHGSGRDGRA